MGVLYVVATPIGNLEDMSYRAVRILKEVDVVAAEDTRSAQKLFERYEIRAKRLISYFEGNEAARSVELVKATIGGADASRLHPLDRLRHQLGVGLLDRLVEVGRDDQTLARGTIVGA